MPARDSLSHARCKAGAELTTCETAASSQPASELSSPLTQT